MSRMTMPREKKSFINTFCNLILIVTIGSSSTLFGQDVSKGRLLPGVSGHEDVNIWWAGSSASKILPDQLPPHQKSEEILIRTAGNEAEAVQLFFRSSQTLNDFRLHISPFKKAGYDSVIDVKTDILRIRYMNVSLPTDQSSRQGLWPDALPPINEPLELAANANQGFWVRVKVPASVPGGSYQASVRVHCNRFEYTVPLVLHVYDFSLPEQMTCITAFGLSSHNIFKYHNLRTDQHRRLVLDQYLANLSEHHISPYDPAPLDPIKVTWPAVKPPVGKFHNWEGLRIVNNESHTGQGALLIYDDKTDMNVTAAYTPLIKIPEKGLRVNCWYRTAVPDHRFLITLNHYDTNKEWMSGRNNDIVIRGSGKWQNIDELLTDFPKDACYVKLHARATCWTDSGEMIGLVWLDDISVTDMDTGKEVIEGGDFELPKRTAPAAAAEQLQPKLDFTAWDKAMSRAIDHYKFNSFLVSIPGIGGGTYHKHYEPELLGFTEADPEYPILFDSYCRQLEAHLSEKGWLDEAYVYWFDEPSADQYEFVKKGFDKLRHSCPGIGRMLTEQVEPGLIGGPNIWCSISNDYDHNRAGERRKHGEKFWWYVCCGPKAPYTGLFLDHSAPEMRIWLWQTFQRNIEGILVWETNYWSSDAAYPDPKKPQNPYEDAMSWVSGYDTPAGTRIPWGNGDGRFIYPPEAAANADSADPVLEGPVDSIRWENLRDGIEDYEYMVMLRNLLEEKKENLSIAEYEKHSKLLEVPESITKSLTAFCADGEPIEEHRDKLARSIEIIRRL